MKAGNASAVERSMSIAPALASARIKRVALVLAGDFNRLEARNNLLESIVRRIALARPHPNSWERSYRALQAEAVRMLSEC
jgi:Spy/CpxP family protein refolding chaperone